MNEPEQPGARPAWSALPAGAPPIVQLAAGLVSAALIIAGLWLGRELLVPLALAFLLGFLLDPLVVRLKRKGVPRLLAVSAVVLLALGVLAGAGLLLTSQVRALSAELPLYETNIRVKLRELRDQIASPGMLSGAAKTLETVKEEVKAASPTDPPATGLSEPQAAPPQRVQIEREPQSPVAEAMKWLAAASGPLAGAGIAFVFLVLVLLDRQDLRDRLLRLLGGNLHRTTDAMDEASERISRYLLMQLLVNVSYGLPMAVGLWLIGVPGALLWGVVAALMRFVPFLGPVISAVFPLALAFAVDPGWSMFIWTATLIVLLELVSNNIVEPWLYGASTGLSVMSLIVAAIFWTMLWGPVGLVMSTPLTVCLLVIGRHLPGLQFLDILLGSQPVLDAPTRFYQRLIAGDVEEVVDMAEETSEDGKAVAFYGQVALPALRLASLDPDGTSNVEHRHRVVVGMDRVISELREQHPGPAEGARPRVACLGGKWQVDALASRMIAHCLQLSGVPARELEVEWSSAAAPQQLDLRGARIVCLSHFSPEPQAQVRFLCRRLRRRWPDLKIVLGLWNAPPRLLEAGGTEELGVDAVATTVEELVLRVGRLVGSAQAEDYSPAPLPENDSERVRTLHDSGLLHERLRPRFERAAKRAADIFDVPRATAVLLDAQWQSVSGSHGAPAPDEQARTPRQLAVADHVVSSGRSLVVEDVARDPRFASHPLLQAEGVRFWAGAPLRDRNGFVLGALCLLDTRPRPLGERELRLLESMADDLMEALVEDAAGAPGTPAAPPPPPPAQTPEPPSATVGQMVPE
ncbi:AI-2E family transporter [Ramlibacter sp. AN1015]|uniref:AI-2E family transporter n=1 Tax=Ramlibacter sp. AN1015 TaxID=3133428 RepID=UPI0030BE541C